MGKGEGKGKGAGSGIGDTIASIGRGVCALVCFFTIGGPILIGLGAFFLNESLTDTRGILMADYNSAVDSWNSTSRADFAATSWTVSPSSNAGASVALTKIDPYNSDDLKDPGTGFKEYDGLIFHSTSFDCCNNYAQGTNAGDYLADIQLKSGSVELPLADVPLVAKRQLSSTQLARRCEATTCVERKCTGSSSSSCKKKTCKVQCSIVCQNDHNGIWNTNTRKCSVTEQLRGIEVKVDTEGTLEFSNQGGGLGFTGPSYDHLIYESVSSNSNPSPPVDISVTVRSVHDPYVQAALLTCSTLLGCHHFGLSVEENQKIGAALLVAGIIVTAVPICILCYCCRSKKSNDSSNGVEMKQSEPVSAPPAGYPAQQPPQQPAYPPQQPGGYPPQGYPPQQPGGYPPQGYPPQQPGGYPPQGYPPQQPGGYPPQQPGGYPPQGYPPQQQGGYPPQGYPQGGYQ